VGDLYYRRKAGSDFSQEGGKTRACRFATGWNETFRGKVHCGVAAIPPTRSHSSCLPRVAFEMPLFSLHIGDHDRCGLFRYFGSCNLATPIGAGAIPYLCTQAQVTVCDCAGYCESMFFRAITEAASSLAAM